MPKNHRNELIVLMDQRLADFVDLQLQKKQDHWSVKGPDFIGLHELFDKVDTAVESCVYMIADRVVQLDGIVEGTEPISAARRRLVEYPLGISDGGAHIEVVPRATSAFAHEARSMIANAGELYDAVTAGHFTEVARGTDKWLWFAESHSQPRSRRSSATPEMAQIPRSFQSPLPNASQQVTTSLFGATEQ